MPMTEIQQLLWGWMEKRLDKDSLKKLRDQTRHLQGQINPRFFFTTFSMVTRFVKKDPLNLSAEELAQAGRLILGWCPKDWQLDEAARACFLVSLPSREASPYIQILDKTSAAADLSESLALTKALALLPFPELHLERARLALRSNIKTVFNALALNNPYPCRVFDDPTWNQMILKALFIGTPLNEIYGKAERANATLKTMLIDFAREREQAGRSVAGELWQYVELCQQREVPHDG